MTQDLSSHVLTKRHLSIQRDSWIGRWPKSTHQTGHRNFLLPQQCQNARNWNLICPFLMSAPSDALKCDNTGSSWRAMGSQGKRTGILLGAHWESLSMWIKKEAFQFLHNIIKHREMKLCFSLHLSILHKDFKLLPISREGQKALNLALCASQLFQE